MLAGLGIRGLLLLHDALVQPCQPFFSRLTGMRCNGFITILIHFYCLHLLLLPWLFWTFTLDGIQLVQMCTILIQMFAGVGI
jgi:hypothetical protein